VGRLEVILQPLADFRDHGQFSVFFLRIIISGSTLYLFQ